MAGAFPPYSWPTQIEEDYVCSSSPCFEAEEEETGYFSECCDGHYENSKLLDFVTGNKTGNGFGMENFAVLAAMDPTSPTYSMNYIYDDIEWSHCDEDFESLITDLYTVAQSTITQNSS
jgi:hypothetical protein